ncbi:MAG: S16 family serine protease [Candidatus Nezhaarchaeales archaeon]
MGRAAVAALALALAVSLGLNLVLASLVLRYQGAPSQPGQAPPEGWKYVNIVGVSQEGEGVVLKVYAKIEKGAGRVFVATSPRVGIELQEAAEAAFRVAGRLSGLDTSAYDAYLLIVASSDVYVVDGPSAGASIAVLLTCVARGVSPDPSVVMTGAVREDGAVDKVGGVLEKALAAAKEGARLFLVPRGQARAVMYEERRVKVGPFTFVTREPVEVDVREYVAKMGYSMEVVEVGSVAEALNYFVAQGWRGAAGS